MSRHAAAGGDDFESPSSSILSLVIEFALASDRSDVRDRIIRELFARTRLNDDQFAALIDKNQLSARAREREIDFSQAISELLAWRLRSMFGRTLLHEAVVNDNVECARHLLLAGASVNAPNDPEHGWTPIIEAVVHAGPRMCALLMLHGADCHQPNADGMSAAGRIAVLARQRERAKCTLLRVWLAPDQMSDISFDDFDSMPRSFRDRIRTFLLCWTRLRRENTASDYDETANLGHLDRLCLTVVLDMLWKEERRDLLESIVSIEDNSDVDAALL